MENELKVKITGDVSDLKTALDQSEKSIDKFGKTTKTASKETKSLKGGTEQLGKQLTTLAGDAQSAEGSIGDMVDGLGQGGLLGIGVAVIGAIGLFIAKVKEAQEELGALATAQAKAVGSAEAEIASLEALVKIANDETRSREERERALGQINSQYSDYLGNLSLEELATEKVTKQINLLTESLIRQAKIKGAQDLIAKESAKLFEVLANGPIGAADSIDVLQASLLSLGSVGNNFTFAQNLVSQGFDTQGKIVEEAEKKIESYKVALNSLLGEDIAAGGLSTKEGDSDARKAQEKAAKESLSIAKKSAAEREKIYRDYVKNIESINKDLANESSLGEDVTNVAQIYEESGARIKKATEEIKQDPLVFGVDEAFLQIQQLEAALDKLRGKVSDDVFQIISTYDVDQLKEFENNLKNTQAAVDTFANASGAAIGALGDSLAEGLKTDSEAVNAFTKSIIKSGEQLLQQLIQQAIEGLIAKKAATTAGLVVDEVAATGSAVAAGAETASTTGPAAAFLLPVLIGAAIGFIAASFAGLHFAGGGIVPGGQYNGDGIPALLNSGEMVLNARQQSNLFSQFNRAGGQFGMDRAAIEVVGVLRGQDILLSSTRAQRTNNRFS